MPENQASQARRLLFTFRLWQIARDRAIVFPQRRVWFSTSFTSRRNQMVAQRPEELTFTHDELVWSQIVAKSWCDDDFERRLFSEPRAVLAEHDLQVPSHMDVEVVRGEEAKVNGTNSVRRFV